MASWNVPLARRQSLRLLLLALLCLLAYARSLRIPLLEDDYPFIAQAQIYGAPETVPVLFHHAVYRVRATSIWTAFWLEQWFDVAPLAYRLVSLVLHVACTWLVFGIGLAWVRMRQAAFWAAAFFAVAEGHQEAVMWFTAINEL